LALCAILTFSACSSGSGGGDKEKKTIKNTYEAPIILLEEQENSKSYINNIAYIKRLSNGFAESELATIEKIYTKSGYYKDNVDDWKEYFQSHINDLKEGYGSNYKFTIKIEEKEKLGKDSLAGYQDSLRYLADQYDNISYDPNAWADHLGISESDAKKLVKALQDIGKLLAEAEVTEAYSLNITTTITGSELDEPYETSFGTTVCKVDGQWIHIGILNYLSYYNLCNELGRSVA
jgi:hypothetical protein